jgi:putative FmdB family regulatory protein
VPTYQYSCTDCGHFFEAVQSFSDDSLTVCPECEGRLRKVFNAVGVVFKGSGFYRNDSRGPNPDSASKNGASKDGATKDGAKDTPKKDAAKSESSSSGSTSGKSSESSSSSTPSPAA